MEFFHAFLVSLLTISFSFFICYLLFNNKPSNSGSSPLPPGQFGWLVIGESLAFLRSGWKGQPENFVLDRMNKYSTSVFKTNLFGEKTVVFCGAMANKFLFSNENKLVQVWWPSSIHKIFPPSEHANAHEESLKLKSFVHTTLRMEALVGYIGLMDEMAQKHFKNNWENKSQVIVHPLTTILTFSIACKVFLSVEHPKQVEKLAQPFHLVLSALFSIPIKIPGSAFKRGVKASIRIRKMIIELVKERKYDLDNGKATTSQDIMSQMVLAKDEKGKLLENNDIANMIIGLLVGGHDTLTSMCAIIIMYLAHFPHIYHKVYKEQIEIARSKACGEYLNWDDLKKMKYSWNVACEVLRISPPFQGMFREAMIDFNFNGFCIPKGWKIYWSTYSTHKNPEFFHEPQKFDPSRFTRTGPAPYTFIPFGGGPRMCPGNEYARLVILVFMHNLVKRFKFEKIIPEEKIVINQFTIPAKGLPIRLFPQDA